MTPEEALGAWYPGFVLRPDQKIAVERLLEGRSALVLMPTGGGKSLAYQLPVLVTGRIGLIISPLIALMHDQVLKLEARGIRSLSLGGIGAMEAQEKLAEFAWEDGPGFVFASPERAETDGFLEHLLGVHRKRIGLVAIDEAHCISQWGHDFRPPYKAIPGFLDRAFGRGSWPPVLCLTATMDERTEAEVLSDFRMGRGDVVRSRSMLRTNLGLRFKRFDNTDDKLTALDEELAARKGEKIIVYTHLKQNKKAGTRAVADRLVSAGHRAAAFDADLPLPERVDVARRFAAGDLDVVCATGAFGMGIDIQDIRGVVHFLLPESLEQYYQEVGRAGRDGKDAFGLLLYTPKNAKVRSDLIQKGRITSERVQEVWSDLINVGRAELRTLSPAVTFDGKDDAYALFHAFQRCGALEVVARGPGRLAVFKACGPDGSRTLDRLTAATKTGNILAAFRKLGIAPHEGYSELFNLYRQRQIALERSPDNVLVFRAGTLSAEAADAIAADFDAKVEFKLQEFEAFDQIVVAADNPDAALSAKFDRRAADLIAAASPG